MLKINYRKIPRRMNTVWKSSVKSDKIKRSLLKETTLNYRFITALINFLQCVVVHDKTAADICDAGIRNRESQTLIGRE